MNPVISPPAALACPICAEINGLHDSRYSRVMKVDPPVVERPDSNFFLAIPSLGALVPGHSLLVTRGHNLSVAVGLAEQVAALDFFEFLGRMIAGLRLESDDAFLIFEHGSTRPNAGLCSTAHAHVHLLPLAQRLVKNVVEKTTEMGGQPISWGSLPSLARQAEDFIWVSANNGEGLQDPLLLPAHGLPSQLMRRIVADQLGQPEWDWRLNVAEANVLATVRKLKSVHSNGVLPKELPFVEPRSDVTPGESLESGVPRLSNLCAVR
jgi:hypothetical protein